MSSYGRDGRRRSLVPSTQSSLKGSSAHSRFSNTSAQWPIVFFFHLGRRYTQCFIALSSVPITVHHPPPPTNGPYRSTITSPFDNHYVSSILASTIPLIHLPVWFLHIGRVNHRKIPHGKHGLNYARPTTLRTRWFLGADGSVSTSDDDCNISGDCSSDDRHTPNPRPTRIKGAPTHLKDYYVNLHT